jgi:double-stranded uracil-DNA glycosylase
MSVSGHRINDIWMGSTIETLADLIPSPAKIICIGINPSLTSVQTGHYYQGRLGQAFFRRLQIAGLLPDQITGYEDDVAYGLGIGFTDIIKRPTNKAGELCAAEFQEGRKILDRKISKIRPEAVIFTFKKTAATLFGSFKGCGWLPNSQFGGIRSFVMPGPYAKREEVNNHLNTLREELGVFK